MASAKGDGEGDVVKETRVETVDFRSQAGQRGATTEPVQVVHQHHPSGATGASAGVVGSAASAVARSIESAKEMLIGKGGTGGDAN